MINLLTEINTLTLQLKEAARDRDTALQLYMEVVLQNKALEERCRQLEALCDTDPLTKLLNKRGLMRHLIERVATIRRITAGGKEAIPFAIVFLDVNHFKQLNDSLGHEVGDQILEIIASALRDSFTRETDFIGRFGGDEMVIGCECASENIWTIVYCLREAHALFQKREESVVASLSGLSLSAGIHLITSKRYRAWRESNDVSDEKLAIQKFVSNSLGEADKAMYLAKQQGRVGNVCWLTEQMDPERKVHPNQMVASLRE